jgi:cyclopropane fatty-acyl-phospholipid synthase-like methyltransferase
MMIRIDPENNETHALLDLVDFTGKHVLEIGCGDGRLTWRYVDKAAQVTAIEPSAEQIALAMEKLPDNSLGRVEFHVAALEDFAANSAPSIFDLVILSYSLC